MDYTMKRSTRYKTMSAQGVQAGKLSCLNLWNGLWKIELKHAPSVTRERAKELALEYLTWEFDAYGVTFVVSKPGAFGQFEAKFYTNAL